MRLIIISLLFTIVLFSCRKDEDFFEDPSASLVFSSDTVSFDTVFTSIGTATQNIRVYNPYKERIKINSIRLVGGQQSTFRMNVDGASGPFHQNIEIAGKDSIYIFIEATIDPNNTLSPFVIEDQIEFNTNGNSQNINLVAWGQNAIYFTPTSFNQNLPDFTCLTGPCSDTIPPVDVTWTKDLPYVVYGYIAIDTLDKLTIEAGARVYFHNNGGMWVYRGGTLQVNGTKEEPVTFQGDRLEARFNDVPGQWDRIWINEGGQNEINYAIIKNAFIGIQAEALITNQAPNQLGNLTINNTIIDNCSGTGLLTSLFNLTANNLLISDCGEYNTIIQAIGNYAFNHCTFANYYTRSRRETPLFFVKNSLSTSLGLVVDTPNVDMRNSIIYGSQESEFNTEIINQGTIRLDFRNVLLKTDQSTANTSQFQNIIRNPTGSVFDNPLMGDFELSENSAARNVGDLSVANILPIDLVGNSRTADGMPDLGVFEFQP